MAEIASGPQKFILNENGTFSILDERYGAPVLEGASAAVEIRNSAEGEGILMLDSKAAESVDVKAGAGELAATFSFPQNGISFIFYARALEDVTGFSTSLELKNEGASEISGIDFYPLMLERTNGGFLFGTEGGRDFRFLRNGMITWSHAGMLKPGISMKKSLFPFIHDACENTGIGVPEGKGNFIGEWFTAIREMESGRVIVTGFAKNNDQMGQVAFKSGDGWFRHLKAVSRGEGTVVKPGESLKSEELIIVAGGPEDERPMGFDHVLRSYASESAKACPPPDMPENPVGWCSWYYYFHDMSEKVIVDNIEAARDLRDRVPIDLIQIDDGYQTAPGDWLETTKKFPRGMAWLADKIRDEGFTPGIWLSPFQATNRSTLFKEHRDWFVKNEKGDPRFITLWPSPYAAGLIYGLDTTNPEVLDWLKMIFRTVVHEWGYEYLKLDFLYTAAIDGLRHDNRVTRAQAFRRGLEAVREAAGDETYILGCGVPLNLGRGIMNGARISGDTAPYWHSVFQSSVIGHSAAPGVPNAARNLFARYFMHRTFFMSDADCLMARFTKTRLGGDEVLTHAACVALAGGPLMISDNLTEYDSASVRLAQKLIPPVDTPAIPVDLFESSLPATLAMPIKREFDDVTIVGRFNWGSREKDLDVEFEDVGLGDGTYHVFDLWEDRYYGVHRESVTLPKVPPHASRLLSVRPVLETPQVIATTFHFTQGGMDMKAQKFDRENNTLTFRLQLPGRRSGRVYFHVPEGFKPGQVVVDGKHETVLKHEKGQFFWLDLKLDGELSVEINFKR